VTISKPVAPFTCACAWLVTVAASLLAPPSRAQDAASPAPPAVATSPNPLPRAPQVEKLASGLTVVTLPFDSPGIVAYDTLVQAGSRDEVEPGKSGYAHLFEHLMFRGTDAVPAEEYLRQLQSLGADDNAFTTDDLTLYTTTIPSDALGELIKLNADRFQHLHYAPDKYKDETGAVLGERNKAFASPDAVIEETLRALAFKSHTYGHTTIGSKHDVEDMPNQYEYSRQFFRRFYTPDDCVIFVVGDFDRDKTIAAIKDAYGAWRGTRARTAVKAEPEQKAPRARSLTWHGETDPRLAIAYRIPSMKASLADGAAFATLAAAVLGTPSDLYQRLVVNEQKVLDLGADPRSAGAKDPSTFEIDAHLKATSSFDEVIGVVQGALDAAAKGQLAPEKIEAARDHLLNETILLAQTPSQVARALAVAAGTVSEVQGYPRYVEALAAVKPEDVARVAKQLTPAHRSVVTLVAGSDPGHAEGEKAKTAAKKGSAK
jgi:zinc protease